MRSRRWLLVGSALLAGCSVLTSLDGFSGGAETTCDAECVDGGNLDSSNLSDGSGANPSERAGDAPAGTFTIALESNAYTVRQGDAFEVRVTVTRSGAETPLSLLVAGLPGGTTQSPVNAVLQPGETTKSIFVSTQGATPQGSSRFEVSAVVPATGASATARASLLVRGAQGTLDKTFAGTGLVVSDDPDQWFPSDVSLATDGTLTIAASVLRSEPVIASPNDTRLTTSFGLLRVTPDGRLDPGFGAVGKVNIAAPAGAVCSAINSSEGGARRLRMLGDGSGFLAFEACGPQPQCVLKVRSSGGLETSFGSSGYACAPVDGVVSDAVPNESGGVLLVGERGVNGQSRLFVARTPAAGAVTPSYGDGGVVLARVPPGSALGGVVDVDAAALVYGETPDGRVFVSSLGPSGGTTPGFGAADAGTSFLDIARPASFAVLTVTSAAAYIGAGNPSNVLVGRLSLATGELEPGFAAADAGGALDGGPQNVVRFGKTAPGQELTRLLVQSDGKLLAVVGSDASLLLARYLPTGAPDVTFARAGVLVLPLTSLGSILTPLFPVLGPEGTLVVVGQNQNTGLTVARIWL